MPWNVSEGRALECVGGTCLGMCRRGAERWLAPRLQLDTSIRVRVYFGGCVCACRLLGIPPRPHGRLPHPGAAPCWRRGGGGLFWGAGSACRLRAHCALGWVRAVGRLLPPKAPPTRIHADTRAPHSNPCTPPPLPARPQSALGAIAHHLSEQLSGGGRRTPLENLSANAQAEVTNRIYEAVAMYQQVGAPCPTPSDCKHYPIRRPRPVVIILSYPTLRQRLGRPALP